MTTLRGAVVGAVPTETGPRGRARCRKESSAMMELRRRGGGGGGERRI
jgi:hypothetical protein